VFSPRVRRLVAAELDAASTVRREQAV